MTPDAIIRVRFLTTLEGGRENSVVAKGYGCPVLIDDHGFDCRFCVDEFTVFALGETYEIPVKFLNPQSALCDSNLEREISLWEGKIIAKGSIVRVLSSSNELI